MSIIEDGTGQGASAEVNSSNQLSVVSESIPSEGLQSRSGKSFIIHSECHTAAAASGALMSITNNEGSDVLEVTRIYIDAHTITPTDLVVTQVFNASLTGGTDVSSTAVVNKNRTTGSVFDLTVLASDASANLTYTNGDQYHAFPVKTMSQYQRNMQNTNILGAGDSITFGWKTVAGGNATDAEIISISINVVKRSAL